MSSHRAAPQLATFVGGVPDKVLIDFDANLLADPVLDPLNWTVRWNNFTYTVDTALSSAAIVQLSLTQAGANPGPDVVSFAPPPFDVISLLSGLPVNAFTDYPVV